jgi:hypothetical protein
LLNIGCFLVTLPYALIDLEIGFINAALLVYNVGISSLVMIFYCTYNTTSLDLGTSQFMNYQGVGLSQFIIVIPMMAIPVSVYLVFDYFEMARYAYMALGGAGLVAIIFNQYLLQMVTRQFVKRKYKMALGFRQK